MITRSPSHPKRQEGGLRPAWPQSVSHLPQWTAFSLIALAVHCGVDPAAVQLATQRFGPCARFRDGSVRCLVGAGSSVVQGLTGFSLRDLRAANSEQVCGLSSEGRVVCWTDSGTSDLVGAERCISGPLGSGCRPTEVPGLPPIHRLFVGYGRTCALGAGDAAWCWGAYPFYSGVGTGTQLSSPARVRELDGAVELSLDYRGCARFIDGSVRCWGPWVGDGTAEWREMPTTIQAAHGARQIAAGRFATCAVFADHSVWCWGLNLLDEQIRSSERCSPGRCLMPLRVGGLTSVLEVQVGVRHACARTDVGSVFCWGLADSSGPDGRGFLRRWLTAPAQVSVRNVTQLGCGATYTCALTGDGKVFCWGGGFGSIDAPSEVTW